MIFKIAFKVIFFLICISSYASSAIIKNSNEVFFNINMKKQVLIKNSERVPNLFDQISVLPKAAAHNENFVLDRMENWSELNRKSYQVTLYNEFGRFGGLTVDLTYHLDFFTGGTYLNSGSYLHAVNVLIDDFYVMDGLQLEVITKVLGVSNLGTRSNPNPILMLKVTFFASRLFYTGVYSDVFYISGNGDFKRISE